MFLDIRKKPLDVPGVPPSVQTNPSLHVTVTVKFFYQTTITPPKFNIAPEKWWLEDEFPFGIAYF